MVAIGDDHTARAFVEQHHYSGSYPAARFRFGLYRHGRLVGVAVFSHPCNDRVLTSIFPAVALRAAVELGRFVLLDEVPANGETWMLARTFELLRASGIAGVVSFSDPQPRTRVDGTVVFPGHVGTIYQAHNGVFLGRSTARTLRLLPDARVFSDRAIQKIRAAERGWRSALKTLTDLGADALTPDADTPSRYAWLADWLPVFTRTMRHRGNLRYAWGLRRGLQPAGVPLPYPKQVAA